MTAQYSREQLNAAVWEATGGDVASALEIAAGWSPDAIEAFAAPLREFVDGLDRLARSRR
jgi:hypothetical protein